MAQLREFNLSDQQYNTLVTNLPFPPGTPHPPPPGLQKRGVLVFSYLFKAGSLDPTLVAYAMWEKHVNANTTDENLIRVELTPVPGSPPIEIPEPYVLSGVQLSIADFETLKHSLNPLPATFHFRLTPGRYPNPGVTNSLNWVMYKVNIHAGPAPIVALLTKDANPSPPATAI